MKNQPLEAIPVIIFLRVLKLHDRQRICSGDEACRHHDGLDNGIWTGVCGEIAGDICLTPLLIGLRVEELSVGPLQVARVGQAIMDLSLSLSTKHYGDLLD